MGSQVSVTMESPVQLSEILTESSIILVSTNFFYPVHIVCQILLPNKLEFLGLGLARIIYCFVVVVVVCVFFFVFLFFCFVFFFEAIFGTSTCMKMYYSPCYVRELAIPIAQFALLLSW